VKKSNILKKSLFFSVLCVLIMIVISIMVRYDVEGEKELPFSISKILLVSTVDGQRVDDKENIWNINVTQVNDVFMYINKTSDDETLIKSIKLENFVINNAPKKGEIELYRPTGELSNLYSQSEQNYIDYSITYLGGVIDDMKSLEIANQGGVLGFRFAVTNIGSYVSNENTEIIYDGRLLTNLGISEEEVKFDVSFDITIETDDNIKYRGRTSLDMPVSGFIEQGSASIEITDFSNVIFKRI